MSADVGIGHQINIDMRCLINIECWSSDVATEI